MFRKRRQKSNDLPSEINDNKNLSDKENSLEDVIDIPTKEETTKHENKRIMYNSESSGDSDGPDIPIEDESLLTMNRFITEPSPTKIDNNFLKNITARQSQSSKPGPSKDSTSEMRPKSGMRPKPNLSSSETDSETDDEVMMMEHIRGPIPGEYDPEKYNSLQVGEETRELFQYITKYTPQHLNLDYKFRPFIPEYIPAVGDIDAFLKVAPPEKLLSGETSDFGDLGLAVLDEPASNQSDSALLHLQLRAVSVTTNKDNKNMIIKKIDNVEKNSKVVDKWIKDISDLHGTKPPPTINYTNSMPDLDNLMQEWPPQLEMMLRKDGFPTHKLHCSLKEYIDVVCAIFDIPVYENRIESLHMFFSLFIAIKNSQLYQVGAERDTNGSENDSNNIPDQLILD